MKREILYAKVLEKLEPGDMAEIIIDKKSGRTFVKKAGRLKHDK